MFRNNEVVKMEVKMEPMARHNSVGMIQGVELLSKGS